MIKHICSREDVDQELIGFYDEMLKMSEASSMEPSSLTDIAPDEPVHINISFLKILSATADIYIGFDDIKKTYADFDFYVLGMRLIHVRLDFNNPKIQIRLAPIPGTRVVGEAGIDFNARKLYIRGTLITFGHEASFDITLFNF